MQANWDPAIIQDWLLFEGLQYVLLI